MKSISNFPCSLTCVQINSNVNKSSIKQHVQCLHKFPLTYSCERKGVAPKVTIIPHKRNEFTALRLTHNLLEQCEIIRRFPIAENLLREQLIVCEFLRIIGVGNIDARLESKRKVAKQIEALEDCRGSFDFRDLMAVGVQSRQCLSYRPLQKHFELFQVFCRKSFVELFLEGKIKKLKTGP